MTRLNTKVSPLNEVLETAALAFRARTTLLCLIWRLTEVEGPKTFPARDKPSELT